MTVIVGSVPNSSSTNREGLTKYLAQFSFAEEKNLATYWEGLCLALISIIAFERFLCASKSARGEKQSWIGLSILAAGLSLDEIASIHERSSLIFSTWGLTTQASSKLPLALPPIVILIYTLQWLWRLSERRKFWLTVSAFAAFGTVAFQEHLEFNYQWPWWAQGIRAGLEEGTELFGVFLLLKVVAPAVKTAGQIQSIASFHPSLDTVLRLKPIAVFVTLLLLVPLGTLTSIAIVNGDMAQRGIPASWLPFMLLNLTGIAAWAHSQLEVRYRVRFLLLAFLSFLFALDQILIFERIIDKNLIRGALGTAMFPCMVAVCASIPSLRVRFNTMLTIALLPLSFLSVSSSSPLVWITVPVQSLGLYYILASEMTAVNLKRVNICNCATEPSLHGTAEPL